MHRLEDRVGRVLARRIGDIGEADVRAAPLDLVAHLR